MSKRLTHWRAIAWNLVVALTGVVVVVMLAGDERGVWKHTDKTLFWAAVVGAGVPVLDHTYRAVRRFRGISRAEAHARVQLALVGCLVEISEMTGVSMQYLGASVFAIRWRYRWHDCWWHPQRRLVRGHRFRLRNDPQPTQVSWLMGKGAIGSAWQTGRPIHRDWRPQLKSHSSPTLSAATFAGLAAHKKDGFKHPEFVRIAPKYHEIKAVPIVSEAGEILGVVSIDVSAKAELDSLVLGNNEVETCITTAASLVRDDLRDLYPQE